MLLYIWILFTTLATLALAAVLFWAVRSGQFTQQDRARYLPLRSRIVPGEKGGDGHVSP